MQQDMVARLRITIDVPFNFDLHGPNEEEGPGQGHDESRINSAKHAEEHLINNLKNIVASHGQLVDILIEEVREA